MQAYFVIALYSIVSCVPLVVSHMFHAEPAFNDRMCSLENVQFQTSVSSKIWCVKLCATSQVCHGVIFYYGNNTCYGLKTADPFVEYFELPGAVFYKLMTTDTTPNPTSTTSSLITSATPMSTTASTTSDAHTTTTNTGTTTNTTTPTTTTTSTTTTSPNTETPTITTTSTTTTTPAIMATSTITSTPTTTTNTTTPLATTTPTTTTTTTTSLNTETPTITTTSTTTTTPAITATSTITSTPTTTTTPISTTTSTTTTTPALTTTPPTTIGCQQPLVLNVTDAQLSCTTTFGAYGVVKSRLGNNQCWIAKDNDANQYIQVDFLSPIIAVSVTTQGCQGSIRWTSSYHVLTSDDCVDFVYMTDSVGSNLVFPGNFDEEGLWTNVFAPAVLTRCFRIHPITWLNNIAIRFAVNGCAP